MSFLLSVVLSFNSFLALLVSILIFDVLPKCPIHIARLDHRSDRDSLQEGRKQENASRFVDVPRGR